MGFESMIRLCVCTKKSSSPFENLKQREGSKSCKSCGGKLPVDGRGLQRGSMLSTVELELSKVIDPQLTWKTASNGRQRAVRRARTSFTGANTKKLPANCSKSSKDPRGKDLRSTSDMPVSESEKLGVSILGRRFSDNLGSVPIKKRRLLLVHSPSPPHNSSNLNGSGHVFEKQLEDTMVIGKDCSLDTNSSSGSESGLEENFGIDKIDQERVNGKISDAADFSGISILAAAACDSNLGGEFLAVENSLSKVHSSEIQEIQESAKVDFSPDENLELLPHSSEDLAGRTDLPFETSSSSVFPSKESNEKSDGSCNVENSVNSLPSKTTESSSRDVRFHWDLNTVMDAWEGHEEGLNSEQRASFNVSEDVHHDEKLGTVEPFMDQVGFADTKDVPTSSDIVDGRVSLGAGEENVTCAAEVKTEAVSGSVAGKETKPCVASACGCILAEECEAKDVNQNCSVSDDLPSPPRSAKISAQAIRDSSSSSTFGLEEEKAEALCQNLRLKVETGRPFVVSCDVVIADHPPNIFGPQRQVDKGLTDARADVLTEGTIHTGSLEIGKCELYDETLSIVPGTLKNDRNLVDCLPAETGYEVLVDGDIGEDMVTGSVENLCTNMLDETDQDDTGKSKEKDTCEGASVAMEMKVDDTTCCAPMEVANAAKQDSSSNFGPEVNLPDSSGITPVKTDAPPQSLGAEAAHTDVCPNGPGRVTAEDHLEYDCYSDVSKDDINETAGMEKFEFLGDDDDSQYEDGEFRESPENCWLDDRAEEGETERVDYGSDRDLDAYEAADFTSANRKSSSAVLPEGCHVVQCQEVGKHRLDGSSRFLESCPADGEKKDVENVTGLQGNLRVITGSNHLVTDLRGTSEFCADTGSGIRYNGFLKDAVGMKGSIHSSDDSRLKMSGWDKLPVGCRNSGNGMVGTRVGSVGRNHNDAYADLSRDGDSIKRDVGSSFRRDFSSQTERRQPSDLSRRHDKLYVRSSRSNDRNDFNPRDDRDAHNRRSIGRSAPPLHLQGRGRGDHWVNSTNHHGRSQHESPSYYGSGSCSHHGSRNAAAAAVAKVESNGFVVAPDGTIVKANGAGISGRSVNASSHSSHRSPPRRGSPIGRERSFGMRPERGCSREMSPDRPIFTGRDKAGRFGPVTVGLNHRERYPGLVSDNIVESPSSLRHAMSRKDGSFSPPHRRPLHLSRSHSRSPSRSRTRSPHRWVSPRGRYDSGPYGGPGFGGRSRSPNFKPEARMHRSRAGFGERFVNYSSFSRNHASPPHSSRWSNGRKELPEHHSEYEYRRCPGRSPPPRVFSRGQRFDSINSSGRPKPGEYYRQPNSGRHPEFVGFDRGDRHDRGDERRDHDSRCGILHSGRQFVNNGNMKRLRYDDENGFRAKNLGPKSSQFQRRDGPRDFDRGTERQLGDSPVQSESAKSRFRSDGDGNHSAKFKSFGVQEGDDNTDAQRRPI